MDAVRVALLREVLDGTEWLPATRRFAGTLRSSVVPHGGGLLLVGTEAYEPWHLAAHLVDEAAWSGLAELNPTSYATGCGPESPRTCRWGWAGSRRPAGARPCSSWRRSGRGRGC